MLVWRSEESWPRLALRYVAIGLIAGTFIAVLEGVRTGQAPRPMLPLILGFVAPFIGLAIRRVLGGRIGGRFVALTAEGIVVGTRPVRRDRASGQLTDWGVLTVPWEEFDGFLHERGVLKLRRRGAPVPVPLDDIFDSRRALADFRNTATALARAYRRWPPT